MAKKTSSHILDPLGAAYCGGKVDVLADYSGIDAVITAMGNGDVIAVCKNCKNKVIKIIRDMITIKGIGQYDPSKKFEEQSGEVAAALQEIVSGFDDFTAIERDQWSRPIKWQQVIDGVTIQSTRTYKTEDCNYYIDEQINTVIDGNI